MAEDLPGDTATQCVREGITYTILSSTLNCPERCVACAGAPRLSNLCVSFPTCPGKYFVVAVSEPDPNPL